MKKVKDYIVKHPYMSQLLACIISSVVVAVLYSTYNIIHRLLTYMKFSWELIGEFFFGILVFAFMFAVMIYPIVVTIYEILRLITIVKKDVKELDNQSTDILSNVFSMLYDLFIVFVGIILEIIVLSFFHDVAFEAQWFEQLTNDQLHTPLNTDYIITFLVVLFMYAVSILALTFVSNKKRPPLVTVSCIALMYMGVIEVILFTIQVLGMNYLGENGVHHYRFTPLLLATCILPFNMILILLRVMLIETKTYEPDENRMSKIDKIPFLSWCNRILKNSKNWPIAAAILMVPILGIIIIILALFGQAPDAAIKVFTETANYTFSKKIPPQNVFYDEHYLCTVAAGGHKKIVKPVRMGKRHGHDVVVNRQLMIANAFEQVLEERTPVIHRKIRNFYDKYGFPIAKLIRTKLAADIVYFIMKPLEWIFLIVLYFVDVNPEDRISRQYL
ncbi:MAG: hypothetical protein Q4D29_06165 [Lachnospiraceae bacterium]|nr:hypothetical protein [Lachnospiraceae bacterium]